MISAIGFLVLILTVKADERAWGATILDQDPLDYIKLVREGELIQKLHKGVPEIRRGSHGFVIESIYKSLRVAEPESTDRRKDRDKLEYLSKKLELVIIQQKLGDPTRFIDKINKEALLKDQRKRSDDTAEIAGELDKRFAKNQDLDAARKALGSVSDHFKKLTAAIDKKDKTEAAAEQAGAIKHLEAAHKVVEDVFARYRLHEQKRLLDGLGQTAEAMLARQTDIRKSAAALAKAIDAAPNKKPTPAQLKESTQLSVSQKKTLTEATEALELLKEERVRGAVPEVFRQLREDAVALEKRFRAADFDNITKTIAGDMVETLTELVAALKKARKDLDPAK
jgi:hypothetical protein